jgi:four helix bundle protein
MSNKISNSKFDLEERTAKFGEMVIDFCKAIKINEITKPILSQLVRSATSVGANYNEADCAESKKDFEHKLSIAKKESKETKHWLRMIAKAYPDGRENARILWREATELNLIFSAIVRNSKINI